MIKFFIFTLILILIPLNPAFSQPRHAQMGEINLSADDANYGQNIKNNREFGIIELAKEQKKKVHTYADTQQEALDYLLNLHKSITNRATTPIPAMSQDIAQYIASSYLLCSIKKGACQEFLDVTREIDLLNVINGHTNTCNAIPTFWQAWIALDMQKKLDHQARFAQLELRNNFKKHVLPHYLPENCESIIEKIINKQKTNKSAFFQSRYKSDAPIMKALSFVLKMSQYLKNKNIDVFQSTSPNK